MPAFPLPGIVAIILVSSIVVTYPLARLLLWAYRSEVKRQMFRRGQPSGTTIPPGTNRMPEAFAEPRDQLLRELRLAPRRFAAVQAAVAAGLAVYLAVLLFSAEGMPLKSLALVLIVAGLFWPGLLAILLTAGLAPRTRWRLLAVAAAAYGLLAVSAAVVTSGTTGAGQVAMICLIINLPVTLLFGAFLGRRVRAVGPMVFLTVLFTLGAAVSVLQTLIYAPGLTTPLARTLIVGVGLPPLLAIVGLMVIGLIVGLAVGMRLLRLFAAAYARNWVGDDGIVLGALWSLYILTFAMFHLVWSDARYLALGLAALPLYLAATWIGHRLIAPAASPGAPRLLLLRVFADKGPTPDLFRAISRHWRHVGPLVMIGAWDLADVAVEPNEVMTYLRGRLGDSFIRDAPDAVRRLSAAVPRRDPDGRFRCLQFFCFDDVWQPAVEGLMDVSAVVVLDLRRLPAVESPGGGPLQKKKGIQVELEALCQRNALNRSILIHDGSGIVESQLRALGVDPSSVELLKADRSNAEMSTLLTLLSKRCLTTSGERVAAAEPFLPSRSI